MKELDRSLDYKEIFDLNGIVIFLISATIIRLLIGILNRTTPKILSFKDKIPNSMKGKWYIRWSVWSVLILIVALAKAYLRFDDKLSWIMGGAITAFTDFIFQVAKDVKE
nr:hypothetical protein [Tissierella sp.]